MTRFDSYNTIPLPTKEEVQPPSVRPVQEPEPEPELDNGAQMGGSSDGQESNVPTDDVPERAGPQAEEKQQEAPVPDGAAEYSDNKELRPLPSGGGASTPVESVTDVPHRRPVKQAGTGDGAKKPAAKKKADSGMSFIRDFPSYLLDEVRKEFPGAKNSAELLSAFVCAKLGRAVPIPEEVRPLVEQYEGDKSLRNMDSRIGTLEQGQRVMMAVLQEMELGLAYLVADRKGFTGPANDPASIDFLDPNSLAAMERLRQTSDQKRKRDAVRSGRKLK